MRHNFNFILFLTAFILIRAQKDDLFPVFSGGSGHEYVNCVTFDKTNEIIVVGGNTTSSDFGPSNTYHGFLYGLDLFGNFRWGKYFYTQDAEVVDITGC